MGKGGLACAAPFPKSCAQIGAQDSGCFFYNRSDQQNFKITKFIVDYRMPPAQARVLIFGGQSPRNLQIRPSEFVPRTSTNRSLSAYCPKFELALRLVLC